MTSFHLRAHWCDKTRNRQVDLNYYTFVVVVAAGKRLAFTCSEFTVAVTLKINTQPPSARWRHWAVRVRVTPYRIHMSERHRPRRQQQCQLLQSLSLPHGSVQHMFNEMWRTEEVVRDEWWECLHQSMIKLLYLAEIYWTGLLNSEIPMVLFSVANNITQNMNFLRAIRGIYGFYGTSTRMWDTSFIYGIYGTSGNGTYRKKTDQWSNQWSRWYKRCNELKLLYRFLFA